MAILTKSQQVNRYLRSSIIRGKWAAGQKLPSEQELTGTLGASHRVIREAMIQLANEGLIERKQGSGTYVAPNRRAGTIALLANINQFTPSTSYVFQRMLNDAKESVEKAGYRSMLFVGQSSTEEMDASSTHLFDKAVLHQVAGVLSMVNMVHMEGRLEEEGIPCVSLGGYPISRYSVVVDFPEMTRQAVEMLKGRGHHEFALMHFDYSQVRYDRQVADQVTRLVHSVGQSACVQFIPVPITPDCRYAYDAFKRFWAQPNRPRAIFFYDDGLCDVALRAISELGIKVPEELAILTQVNVGRHFPFSVPLTGIGFDPAESIKQGWAMLDRLIKGDPVDQPIVTVGPHVQAGISLGEAP